MRGNDERGVVRGGWILHFIPGFEVISAAELLGIGKGTGHKALRRVWSWLVRGDGTRWQEMK